MKYKHGDKVKIKDNRKHTVRKEALNDIEKLNTNGVFTIDKEDGIIGQIGIWYHSKEFKSSWRWSENYLELVEEYKEPIYERIESRFDILDL